MAPECLIRGAGQGSGSASMTRLQQTVATYFRFSLMDLLAKMVAGIPHFVRCIRPNEDKLPNEFNSEKVTIQLRSTGVLETTRIRREGFSHRIPFSEFLRRYYILGFGWDESVPYTRESCKVLLQRMGLKNWALGNTKVFLKYYHIEQLARKFEDYNKHVIQIQSVIRMWRTKHQLYQMKWQREKATVRIQAAYRAWRVRRKFRKTNKRRHSAAVTIQKNTRGFLARAKVVPEIKQRRSAAQTIQAIYRGHVTRKRIKSDREKEENAIKIQKAFRGHKARKSAQKTRHLAERNRDKAARTIQRNFRIWQGKCRRDKKIHQLHELNKVLKNQCFAIHCNVCLYDLSKVEAKLHPSSPSPRRAPSPQVPGPSQLESFSPVLSKKVHKEPVKPQPDLSIERLDHIEKMQEVKSLMPEAETEYYDRLSLGWSRLRAGDSDSLSSLSSLHAQRRDPPAKHAQNKRHAKYLPDSKNIADWDKPILQAKERILSHGSPRPAVKIQIDQPITNFDPSALDPSEDIPSMLINPVDNLRPPNAHELHSTSSGTRSIETDLRTDREELFQERDKEELKKELEQEVAGSIVALWRQMQKDHHEDDRFSEKSDASSSRTSPVPLRVKWSDSVHKHLNGGPMNKNQSQSQSPLPASKYRVSGKRTVIPVRMFDSESAIDSGDESGPKFDFRAKLRKTNIDLTSTVRLKSSAENAQQDYRNRLRKTGRLLISVKDS
ncbi:hypothetical protein ScPMuIL_017276 [Solemya velum]